MKVRCTWAELLNSFSWCQCSAPVLLLLQTLHGQLSITVHHAQL
jgi:hypothetical protein